MAEAQPPSVISDIPSLSGLGTLGTKYFKGTRPSYTTQMGLAFRHSEKLLRVPFLQIKVWPISVAWLSAAHASGPGLAPALGHRCHRRFRRRRAVDLLRQNTPEDETSEWLMSPGGSVGSFTFTPAGYQEPVRR